MDCDPDGRDAKLQRMLNVGRTTQTALRTILGEAWDDGAPSRNAVTDVAQARFALVCKQLLLPRCGGGDPVKVELCDPNHLMGRLLSESPTLQTWFADALLKHPCSVDRPWSLVVGWDEHVPGNKLALQNSRKSMNVSFSFLELGDVFHNDVAWFTPMVVRASKIMEVDGGWSAILKEYLKLQLTSPGGLQSVSGAAIEVQGKAHCLWAQVRVLLGDGDGHRQAFQWMGAASLKPCFKHFNVMKRDSDRAHRSEDRALPSQNRYVEVCCSRPELFRSWTTVEFNKAVDAIVRARADHLAGACTKSRLEKMEQAYGLKPTEHGLLADPTLRGLFSVQEVFRYDWVHTFLQDGILTAEAWLLIAKCEELGVCDQATVCSFLKEEWVSPAHKRWKGRQLWRIFDSYGEKANRSHGSIKCSASELLGLYAMLRHFVEDRVPCDARLADHRACFLQLCDAVDSILLAKRGRAPMISAARSLRAALSSYLAKHVAVHGSAGVKPKAHWALDIPDQFESDMCVADCFVIERLHLRVKAAAENVSRLETFERSVLSGVVNSHARLAQNASVRNGLVGRCAPFPGVSGAMVADHLERKGSWWR